MSFRKLAFFFLCLNPHFAQAVLPTGQAPEKEITLQGKEGGRLDDSPWSSKELTGKVHMLVYSAPSEKDTNDQATKAVKKAVDAGDIPRAKFASVAVVNMAASAWPNWMISNAIKKKQKQYPDTTYVKDINKTLVKTWNLADDSNDIVVFDAAGKVLFSVDGKLSEAQIKELIEAIKAGVKSMPEAATAAAG